MNSEVALASAGHDDEVGRGGLELLFERPTPDAGEVRGLGMPEELRERYGGELLIPLHSDRPTVISNFVSTLDGVVALGGGDLTGGGLISGFHEPDRYVMGLLRALADVVVVGAGTLRGSTDHRWTPDCVHAESAAAFAAWRRSMGLTERPTTIVVTGSGDIPIGHGGLNDPSIPVVIATSDAGARRLGDAGMGSWVSVEPISSSHTIPADRVVSLTERLGARLVLTEGGPHLLGEFVSARALDELFLTIAPQLVGRDENRLGLVEGTSLSPAHSAWEDLVSVRRSGDHLFLRYRARLARPTTQES